MAKIKFGDVVRETKEKVNRSSNPYEFYVAGDHMDTEDLTIRRKGRFATDDVGPAFFRVFHEGQVLYGSRRTYLKKIAVADFDGVTANTTFVLETKDEQVLRQRLLPFIMYTERFTDWSVKKSRGSTNPYVLFSDLADYAFNLPSIEKQDELAELLWSMVEAKEAYQELLRQTDELVKAQFIEMFGDPVENPMLWETVPFLQTGSCKNGMNFSSKESGIQIECLGVADFQQRMVIDDSVRLSTISLDKMPGSEYLLKDGDIVFVRSNGNKELVGRSAFVTVGDKKVTFSGFCIRYRKALDELNHFYLLHLLRADSVRAKLRGRGANVQNLSQKTLASIDVPVPPLPLQEQFVAFARQADKVKSELEQAVKSLDNTYKKILSENLG